LITLVRRIAPSSDATRKRAVAAGSQAAAISPRPLAAVSAAANRACHAINTVASRARNPSCTSESSEARLPITHPPTHLRSRCALARRARRRAVAGLGRGAGRQRRSLGRRHLSQPVGTEGYPP